jgi:hypothetical protein
MSMKHFYLAVLAGVVACATTGTSSTPGRRGNLLTAMEIVDNHADVNSAYDAVARLRPNWLAPHGPSGATSQSLELAQVFVDGQAYGDVTSMRNIPAYHVGAIEYFDSSQAGAKFGIRAGGAGAIEVRMKKP